MNVIAARAPLGQVRFKVTDPQRNPARRYYGQEALRSGVRRGAGQAIAASIGPGSK